MILQVQEVINITDKISPYNAYAYSAVVFILVLIIYFLYLEYKFWKSKTLENAEKNIILLYEVNKVLTDKKLDPETINEMKKEIITEINNLKYIIKNA
jgi:predicted negative regulator of RcsB-dependent stress response